jgi:hypothetical protein
MSDRIHDDFHACPACDASILAMPSSSLRAIGLNGTMWAWSFFQVTIFRLKPDFVPLNVNLVPAQASDFVAPAERQDHQLNGVARRPAHVIGRAPSPGKLAVG